MEAERCKATLVWRCLTPCESTDVTALCSCYCHALVNHFECLDFRRSCSKRTLVLLTSVICMYRIIPANGSSDFVPKCMDAPGAQLAGNLCHSHGNAVVLIWAVSWCGCEMLWGEKWQSVPGVNEPICVPWKNWVHREWNCNLKKFNTVRASIKIPFRLIKWLSTLTNDKDLTVLGVVAYWWISLQPQAPESPFQGCCLQLPLDALPNCCLCPAHWQPNRIPYSSWK